MDWDMLSEYCGFESHHDYNSLNLILFIESGDFISWIKLFLYQNVKKKTQNKQNVIVPREIYIVNTKGTNIWNIKV